MPHEILQSNSDGRRAEATCKAWRACRAPVDKARKGYLGAYLARPRRCWQPAGRGHPGFGKRDPSEPVDYRRLTTLGRPASLAEQIADLSAEREVARWMARLAARGLPPDWTEEELRRQGHTLDQGYWESEGVYRPGPDEEARTPRAAWTAAQIL